MRLAVDDPRVLGGVHAAALSIVSVSNARRRFIAR
jgi:hypothetical protein